jgi:hypothetical protein
MDIIKVKKTLENIEGIRSHKVRANYVPSFSIVTFSSTLNLKDQLTDILTNHNYSDDKVEFDLVKIKRWNTLLSKEIKRFLLDPPPLESSSLFESDDELIRLVDEFVSEIKSLKNCECFEVKSTHKRFYDLVWIDLLIVTKELTYFLHFGYSD